MIPYSLFEASKVSDYRHEPVPHYDSFNHQTDARRFIHPIERWMNLSDILFYFTSISVMCDLAIFVMNRNVDFMGFLTFQLLMKLCDFDLALVLIRQKSDKI